MRKPLQDFKGDIYERPNQDWICGLSEEGSPCPAGPGAKGGCPKVAACHPKRDGDRWICNRSQERGGICEHGPTPDGECCHIYECRPLHSLRARRGRFVFGSAVVLLGALCIILSANWRNSFLAPGGLSTHHAQLLNRQDKSQGCASCHAAADQNFAEWMQHATDAEMSSPPQTELCLECHKNRITEEKALLAHSIDPQILLANAQLPLDRRLDPTRPLACATCHREHHGLSHDLTWMSNKACQACHQEEYHSFATDHPEFKNWPNQRRTRIAFDHGSHQLKHFPKEKQEFACTECHSTDRDGIFQETKSFEASCAKCHEGKIEASWDNGIAVFALPMIDDQALRNVGRDIGQWPEQALGEFDGPLPSIAKLLLAADQRGAAALVTLGADFDFYDVEPDDPAQLQAAGEIVWATKRLLYDLSIYGHKTVRLRVEKLLGRELTKQEFSAITARLSPENIAVMTQGWLNSLPAEMAGRGPVVPKGNSSDGSATNSKEALNRVTAGGWVHDDMTLSVRYVPTGHADPWLATWIDILVEASTGPQKDIAKPLLKEVMSPTAAGLCGSCHSVDRLDDGTCEVNWFAKRAEDVPRSFTTFSHSPHLTQSQLADCKKCHEINPLATVMDSYQGGDVRDFEFGFQPITKQSCAECHTPQAAGDSCMQCHNYHVGTP